MHKRIEPPQGGNDLGEALQKAQEFLGRAEGFALFTSHTNEDGDMVLGQLIACDGHTLMAVLHEVLEHAMELRTQFEALQEKKDACVH